MTTLHLGVVDIPYGNAYASQRSQGAKALPSGTGTSTVTTGDVARSLEKRYGIMAMFVELHGQEISDEMAEVLRDHLENLLMGAPDAGMDALFAEGSLGAVEQVFREMLDKRELDGQVLGVPTGAAMAGVDHRLQHPYAKRGPRPSFIDTGTYQASMRAWVED